MSRSGKRRAAKKLREGREPISSRTQSPDSGAEDREAERERRDREAEQERLAGVMRVARQRYERALEKWNTFTGESSQPAGDAEEQATSSAPLTGVATEHSQLTAVTRPASNLGFQLHLSGGSSPGARVAAEAPRSLSDDGMGPSTFPGSDLSDITQNFYDTFSTSRALGQGSNSPPLSSPPSDNNSIIDHLAFPPPHPRPGQVATTSGSPGPSTSSYLTAFMTGSLYRPDLIAFSDTDEFDFPRYNAPSAPSVDSADDSYPWRTTASSVPQPSPTSHGYRRSPLLSPVSRELAEETSVLLELLSRTGEVDLDVPGQTKAIERAYENISNLRRHYRIRLANRDGLGTAEAESSKKDEPDTTPESACIICCSNTADVVLIPCHHMVLCEVGRRSTVGVGGRILIAVHGRGVTIRWIA